MKFFDKVKTVAKVGKDKVSKHSPEILVGLGILGFGWTVYESCKSTLKVKEIITDHKTITHQMDVAVNADAINADGSLYNQDDYELDRHNLKYQTGWAVTKAVAKPVLGFASSAALVLGGLHIIKKRYAVLSVAYNGLKASYDMLYSNVEKEYGKEKAYELANGLTKVGETENGDPIYQKDPESGLTAMPYSVYITPNNCKYWSRNEWENDLNIENVQRNANELRECDGYLLYHSVLKDIGYRPRSEKEKNILPISCRTGWVFDDRRVAKARADGLNPDGYVDLRITKIYYDNKVEEARELCDENREAGEKMFDELDELFFDNAKGRYVNYIYMINPNIDGEIYKYI